MVSLTLLRYLVLNGVKDRICSLTDWIARIVVVSDLLLF